jgi:hypothetical protein
MEKIKRLISSCKFNGSNIKEILKNNGYNNFIIIPITSEDLNKLGDIEGFHLSFESGEKISFYKKTCKLNEYKSHPNVENSIKHDLSIGKDYIVFDTILKSVFPYEVIDDFGCLIFTEDVVF